MEDPVLKIALSSTLINYRVTANFYTTNSLCFGMAATVIANRIMLQIRKQIVYGNVGSRGNQRFDIV